MDGLVERERSEDVAALGTRFRVFPQPSFIPGYEIPETIYIPLGPHELRPGPADARMYVIDPMEEKAPYAFPDLPPYRGRLHPPVEPGPDGHFDHIDPDSADFLPVHLYACVRRVLDVCQGYRGGEIPWFFEPTYSRLEIVPWLPWDNAHSGFGFLEMGEDFSRGTALPFALNFDAVAHETAHLALHGVMGLPQRTGPGPGYLAYHEAAADFTSLLALLTFDTALDKILRRTRGNLLIINELDRFTELSDEQQVRSFSHSLKLSDVGEEAHDLSKPFAGALFDTMIEAYHILLLERGLSDFEFRDVEDIRLTFSQEEIEDAMTVSRAEYEVRHFGAKACLEEARDFMGEILVASWGMMSPENLSLFDAADALVAAMEQGRARRFTDRLVGNLAWRGLV